MLNIAAVFPQCTTNACLETTTDSTFTVIDPAEDKKSIIYKGGIDTLSPPYFTIHNRTNKPIGFLAIDHCLFFDHDNEKCDFAVFDNSVFCFVEIKRGSGRKKGKIRKKAIDQLRATIIAFDKCNVDFTGYKREAFVSVGYNESFPKVKSRSQDAGKEFEDDYNVELFQGSEITFQ